MHSLISAVERPPDDARRALEQVEGPVDQHTARRVASQHPIPQVHDLERLRILKQTQQPSTQCPEREPRSEDRRRLPRKELLQILDGQGKGCAHAPLRGLFDQRFRVQLPALEHQTQIDHPFQRRTEEMISQMGDVEQKSVVRRQATTGHILQYSDPRTLPDPVLVNVPLREAESPVHLKAASSLSRRYHLEPSIRSEEHTSELQSRSDLVCRLLLEKKK